MKLNPLVCIIIVTWNNEKDIEICLNSIHKQTYKNIKVVVVDNCSTDETPNIISDKFPEVNLIVQDKNYFLVGSNNYGIKYAIKKYNPAYIMVLNPDTKLEVNVISMLLKELRSEPNVGAVGPKLKFFNNDNEGKLNSTGLIYDGFQQAYDRGFLEEDKGQYNRKEKVFGVSGACILFKTEMLNEIGLYWGRIKMYLDEVELFIRAKKAGWKVLYVPKAVVYHSYMKSTNNNKTFSQEKQKMKAWLFIALRHYPIKSKLSAVLKYLRARKAKISHNGSN